MRGSPPAELSDVLDADDSSREAAWSSFLERYSGLLLHTARGPGGDYDACMDRYQYVIEQLRKDDFKRLRRYVVQSRSRFTTWLVVVSRRLCHDYHRSRYGRDRRSSEGTQPPSEEGLARRRLADMVMSDTDPTTLPDGSGKGPEMQMRSTELATALTTALAPLAPRDRLLIKLRFEDDAAVRDIAAALRYPSIFHVYRRLKVVLGEVRERLIEQGFDDPFS